MAHSLRAGRRGPWPIRARCAASSTTPSPAALSLRSTQRRTSSSYGILEMHMLQCIATRPSVSLTVEVELEGLVGHELVDEHAARAGDAVADEGHEVAVVHPADDIHLGLELALPLPAVGLELLHGHHHAAGEHPLVHVPEPALPQQIRRREVARGHRQLLVAEGALAEPQRLVRGRGRRRAVRAGVRAGGHGGRRRCMPLPATPRRVKGAHRRRRRAGVALPLRLRPGRVVRAAITCGCHGI